MKNPAKIFNSLKVGKLKVEGLYQSPSPILGEGPGVRVDAVNVLELGGSDMDKQLEGRDSRACRFLTPHQLVMIDEALASVGDYGEVRLVLSKGKLRFIVTQTSHDTQKWHFGKLGNDCE